MDNKLLTIAIPTFNRSDLLDNQLEWLAKTIVGFEDYCEIIISNNCSTDHSEEVIQRWEKSFRNFDFKVNHNPRNIGAIKNIALCIKMATAKHVWVISDDDHLFKDSISKVIEKLKNSPELGILLLNFTSFDINKKQSGDKWLPLEDDKQSCNGQSLFDEIFAFNGGWGALIFTSALVYRRDLAQEAIEAWQSGLENLMCQLYITAYCAKHGSMCVTNDAYLQYVHGRSFFNATPNFIKLNYVDKVAVYLKLIKMGYSPLLCKERILEIYFGHYRPAMIARLLVKRPWLTARTMISGFKLIFQAFAETMLKRS
jgi:glycosyltransferase involved in cell wall biosynthesis